MKTKEVGAARSDLLAGKENVNPRRALGRASCGGAGRGGEWARTPGDSSRRRDADPPRAF